MAHPVQDTLQITSKVLGETIRVVTYNTDKDLAHKPIIYITDGQKMIDNGALERIKQLTTANKIPDAYYVFVSTIDEVTHEDKRDTYFFCNADYVQFFEEELIPRVEGPLSRKGNSSHRSLVGISFGGLNAAYFSGKTALFQNYALLSPITYPCDGAIKAIVFSGNKNLRIILTTGTNDAENYISALYHTYASKGYEVEKFSTKGSHDFENWNGQLERVLNFLNKD